MPLEIDFQSEFVHQVTTVFLVLLGIILLTHISIRLARRLFADQRRLYKAKRTIRAIGTLLALLLIPLIFFSERGDLLTLLTVVGAGIAIALREVLLSIAGWLRILMLTSYKQGDRIEINGVTGDVIDLRVLRTTLMETRGWVDADQSTGRIVHIPNSWLFEHALFNYTRGFKYIWNELVLTVTFRSDWRAARDIMQQLAEVSSENVAEQAEHEIKQIQSDYLVHYGILTPYVYVRAVDNGVRLTLRYLCQVRKRRGSEHALTMDFLDAFREHGGIEPAYPMLGLSPPDATPFGPMPGAPPSPAPPPTA